MKECCRRRTDGRKKEVTTAAVIEVSSIVIQLVMRRSALEMIASEILVSLELQPRNTKDGTFVQKRLQELERA